MNKKTRRDFVRPVGIIASLAAATSLSAFAANRAPFDQGKAGSSALSALSANQQTQSPKIKAPAVRAAQAGDQDIPSCKDVTFNANSSAISDPIDLFGMEMHCDEIPTDPGGGTQHICYPRSTGFHQTAQVQIVNRKPLKSSEQETFNVCLTGSWLTLQPTNTVYQYHIDGPDGNGLFTLTPGARIAKAPAPKTGKN